MDKIQSIKEFEALTKEERKKIYENEINRIEKYIYDSEWYKVQSKDIKKIIKKHKSWLLYINKANKIPVRLFGFGIDNQSSLTNNRIIYFVATMEDDEKNSLSIGQIYDIDNKITPITWYEIDKNYINELKKAESYGGDMIFLKPEMFLFLNKFAE